MPRPFVKIASALCNEGSLELHQRGESDFMVLVDGRVLMTSALRTSELFLAEAGCAPFRGAAAPRVLIGGLGLGFSLRAALDVLPPKASVIVSELNEAIVDWNRGPLAGVNARAVLDQRVQIEVGDVTHEIARVAEKQGPRYDAILWDLYVGPTRRGQERHPLYGKRSVERTFAALNDQGIFGVWCETPSSSFEQRLEAAGFSVKLERTRGKGLRHAVYLAQKRASPGRRGDSRRSNPV